ncbi:MAG TPA: hypothetical protein VE467_16590 [Chryseolinea sp.]|jgi:hypothetical protein|nr:hypothetical protein [Chryseolinea sp.]
MKFLWGAIISVLLFQDQAPYKANDEFELKLDLQFKQRPKSETKIEFDRRTLPTGGMNAPYLFLNLKVLKAVPEEVRIKVLKNNTQTLLSRKFDPNVVLKLDLGFTDDIKDRVTAYHYLITFSSKEKTVLSRIEIFFETDGTYLVNGEKRGKI